MQPREFLTDEGFAKQLDAEDPQRDFREQFYLPVGKDGKPLILAQPRKDEFTIATEDILDLIKKDADQLAVVMFGGVNFFTGQLFDVKKIMAAAREHGIIAGFDLAHAIGNVPLSLHDWNVDFAVWCSYKYLNAGPGAVAGAFVHERHATNTKLPRLAGWFGNNPNTRFRLHLEPEFVP